MYVSFVALLSYRSEKENSLSCIEKNIQTKNDIAKMCVDVRNIVKVLKTSKTALIVVQPSHV